MTFRAFYKYSAFLWVFLMILAAASPALAKRPKVGFLSSVEVPDGFEMRLVTADGEELFGHISRARIDFGSMTKLTFKTFDGRKVKLKAADVDLIEIPVDDVLRGIMTANATDTIEEIWKSDFERIFEVEYLEFHSIRHPKSQRVALRQLINPGFDSRLQVYYLPMSKEGIFSDGDLPWFGDMPKAFLVVKDGADPIRVKQWEYRKEVFPELFADCPELLRRYTGDMRKFKFFAEHTYMYDQICPGEGSPTYTEGEALADITPEVENAADDAGRR